MFIGYSQLQCYVCNNCARVNTETPYMTCEDNITTEDPLTTATEYTTISTVTTDSTTSAITKTSTEDPGTTQSITTTTEVHAPTQSETTDFTTQTTTEIPKTTQLKTTESEGTISDTTTKVNTPKQFTLSAASVLQRMKRHLPTNRFNKKSTVQYKCYSLQHAGENKRRVTKRGCVKFQENIATTCDNAIGKGNGFDQCVICGKDRCNFGNTLTVSIITLATPIFILLFRF